MKLRLLLVLAILCFATSAIASSMAGGPTGAKAPAPNGYTLILSENFNYPDGSDLQEIQNIFAEGQFALGDIGFCEPGAVCPSSWEGYNAPPGVSDWVRFMDVPGVGYEAWLVSDPYYFTFIYGPRDINQMIADGFAQPGDAMGYNAGSIYTEAPDGYPSYYNGYTIWSDTPEPGTLMLLGSGLVGLAGFAKRRLLG